MQRPNLVLLASTAVAVFIIFQVHIVKKDLSDVQAGVAAVIKNHLSQK
jgi:hypothetical protein